MVIIHHHIVITNTTFCAPKTTAPRGDKLAVDLPHAIRQADIIALNQTPQLCRGCWENQVEKLQDMLTEPDDEIIEEG